jgi:hypothetical protein
VIHHVEAAAAETVVLDAGLNEQGRHPRPLPPVGPPVGICAAGHDQQGTGFAVQPILATSTENPMMEGKRENKPALCAMNHLCPARLFKRKSGFRTSCWPAQSKHAEAVRWPARTRVEIAARNKEKNYLKAMRRSSRGTCLEHELLRATTPSDQIARCEASGREHFEQFLTSLHEAGSDLEIVVEQRRCRRATGSWATDDNRRPCKPVMGVAPTNRRVQTACVLGLAPLFNVRGPIVVTWNLVDRPGDHERWGLSPLRTTHLGRGVFDLRQER